MLHIRFLIKKAAKNKQIKILDIASGKTYDFGSTATDSVASDAKTDKFKKEEPGIAELISIDLFIKVIEYCLC